MLIACCTIASAQAPVGNKAPLDSTLQRLAIDPGSDYTFKSGDTIVIAKEVVRYLTGEEPSDWVYYVRHTILQVGGKRFPDGILVNGIMSWIGKEGAWLKGTSDTTVVAAKRLAEDKKAIETVQEEFAQKPVEEQKKIAEAAQAIGAETIAEVATPAEQETETPVVEATEEPAVEETATEAPVAEEKAEEPAEEPAEEKAATRQCNRFTIGARAGVASLMHDGKDNSEKLGNWQAGFDALLDLQYAHYWQKENWKYQLGMIVGVSAGYSRSGTGKAVNDAYTVSTDDGDIDYTISSKDINEKDGQIQLEVPIMFSMIMDNGFFLNAGARAVLPVYTNFNQKITEPGIQAYFPEEGVTVTDEIITGRVEDNQMKTNGKWSASKINVFLTAELGYEWKFKNLNSLGLGVYANYSVYTLYNNKTENKSLIDVTAPSASGPASVDVLSATDTYNKGLGYFDAGIKIAYHFNWWK